MTQQWTGFEVRRGRVQHVALVRILRRADRDYDEQSDRFDPADFVRWSRGLPRSRRTAQAG